MALKEEKTDFASIVELGAKLDKNDFAPNAYPVDEEEFPRTVIQNADGTIVAVPPKITPGGPSDQTTTVLTVSTLPKRRSTTPVVLSDSDPTDNVGRDSDDDDPLLGEQVSPQVNKVVLEERRKTIVPQRLFTEVDRGTSTSADSEGPSSSISKGKAVTLDDVERIVGERMERMQLSVLKATELQNQAYHKKVEATQNQWMERQHALFERQQQTIESNQETLQALMKMILENQAKPIQAMNPQMLLMSAPSPSSTEPFVRPAERPASPSVVESENTSRAPETPVVVPAATEAEPSSDKHASEAG